eukprot:jgi/Hompol1/6920/HPOL_000687-RA
MDKDPTESGVSDQGLAEELGLGSALEEQHPEDIIALFSGEHHGASNGDDRDMAEAFYETEAAGVNIQMLFEEGGDQQDMDQDVIHLSSGDEETDTVDASRLIQEADTELNDEDDGNDDGNDDDEDDDGNDDYYEAVAQDNSEAENNDEHDDDRVGDDGGVQLPAQLQHDSLLAEQLDEQQSQSQPQSLSWDNNNNNNNDGDGDGQHELLSHEETHEAATSATAAVAAAATAVRTPSPVRSTIDAAELSIHVSESPAHAADTTEQIPLMPLAEETHSTEQPQQMQYTTDHDQTQQNPDVDEDMLPSTEHDPEQHYTASDVTVAQEMAHGMAYEADAEMSVNENQHQLEPTDVEERELHSDKPAVTETVTELPIALPMSAQLPEQHTEQPPSGDLMDDSAVHGQPVEQTVQSTQAASPIRTNSQPRTVSPNLRASLVQDPATIAALSAPRSTVRASADPMSISRLLSIVGLDQESHFAQLFESMQSIPALNQLIVKLDDFLTPKSAESASPHALRATVEQLKAEKQSLETELEQQAHDFERQVRSIARELEDTTKQRNDLRTKVDAHGNAMFKS